MRYVFLDIETTNEKLDFEIDKSELIEIGAYDFAKNKEFSSFVKINHKLSEFTKRLTGINDNDIENGKDIDLAINKLLKFLGDPKDLVIVGHNIEGFDIPVLKKYSNYFESVKYLDTLQLSLLFFPGLEAYSVEYLYKHFVNNDYKELHRALQDAKDEAELFYKIFDIKFIKKHRTNRGKNIDFLSLLWQLNGDIKSNTKRFLLSSNNNLGRKNRDAFMDNNHIFDYLDKNFIETKDLTKEYKGKRGIKGDILNNFFKKFDYTSFKKTEYIYDELKTTNDEEIIDVYKKSLGNKQEREQQVKIVKSINNILNGFNDKKVLGIEAGTGTGKTYGYLIPAMNFLQKNPDHKVFIATYTKVLQSQIMKEDIGELAKSFGNIKYAQLKANSEGFDLNNIPIVSKDITLYHIMLWLWILCGNYYVSDIHYGLQKNLNHFENTNYIYSYYNKKYKEDYNTNFGFKGYLQENLHTKNLFVVNHSFFISQFGGYVKDTGLTGYVEKSMKEVSFKYHVIFDEGHNLESVMREYFTISYDIITFKKIVDFIVPGGKGQNVFDMIEEEINQVDKQIMSSLKKNNNPGLGEEYSAIRKDAEHIINSLTAGIKDKDLSDYVGSFLDSLIDSDLYRVSKIEIRKLREKYSLDGILFNQSDLFRLYFNNSNNKFFKIIDKLHIIMQKIYKEYMDYNNKVQDFCKKIEERGFSSQALSQVKVVGMYLNEGKNFLKTFDGGDNFIEGFVDFNEGLESLKNFGFKMLPKNLSNHTFFINSSEGIVLLSATLYDSTGKQSYILNEISGEDGFSFIEPIKAPFDYEKNRGITIPNINIDYDSDEYFEKKAEITLEYVKKYSGRTLILTTNNRDKDRIANYLYEKLNGEGIMIKKHEGGSIGSRSNQQNIQSLKTNPNTVLIGSKSYMEGVDIPGENLSLVVLWKLPFLPPTPFVEYQNNKPIYRRINNKYVYQFLCGILFRQSIGRLIRSNTDKGEVLILDPRIDNQNGLFFRGYL